MIKQIVKITVLLFSAFILFSCASVPETVSSEKELQNLVPDTITSESTPIDDANQDTTNENISVKEKEETKLLLPKEDTPTDSLSFNSTLQPIEEPEVLEKALPYEPEVKTEEIIEILPPPPVPEEQVFPEELDELDIIVIEQKEKESETTEEKVDVKSSDIVKETFDTIPQENSTKNQTEELKQNNKNIKESSISFDAVEEITDETEDSSTDNSENKPEPIPSRSVSMKNGESLDVEYPGKGWIFLGCTDGSKKLTSSGRKLGEENTKFTLIARVPGKVILHFYKEDILQGIYIDDYLEVNISDIKSKSSVHVKAPSYTDFVPKKDKKDNLGDRNESQTDFSQTDNLNNETKTKSKNEISESKIIKETPEKNNKPEHENVKSVQKISEPENTTQSKTATSTPLEVKNKEKTEDNKNQFFDFTQSASDFLDKARSAMDSSNYEEAYNNIQAYLASSVNERDEALFMLGQVYESSSTLKDIKKAIESYEQLKDNYPASPYWEEANKRVIYLKRFYINIR